MSTDEKTYITVLEVSGHRLVAGKRKGEVVEVDLPADQVRALIAAGHVRAVKREKKEK